MTILQKVLKLFELNEIECLKIHFSRGAENIQWVSVENIEERDSSTISNVPEMVGSGQSVGGVVSETVGPPCICSLHISILTSVCYSV